MPRDDSSLKRKRKTKKKKKKKKAHVNPKSA